MTYYLASVYGDGGQPRRMSQDSQWHWQDSKQAPSDRYRYAGGGQLFMLDLRDRSDAYKKISKRDY